MAQLQQFNPVGAFQAGRQGALDIQAREQSLSQQPRRNRLLDLQTQQARQSLESQGAGETRAQTGFDQTQSLNRIKMINRSAKALLGLDATQRSGAFAKLEPQLEQFGIPAGTFTPEQLTDDNLTQTIASTQGLISDPSQLSAGLQEQRDVEARLSGGIDPETGKLKPREQLTAEQEAAAISQRLLPGATGSAAQTIAASGTAQDVAETEGIIAGAKEKAKLGEQLTFKPQIQSAIKLATEEATAKGEALTDVKRSEAALPGLMSAIDQLKELAPIATSTFAGRIFDSAVKESGFGSTKGANARVKFIAIINNQVLPLLKPTFGAAFTVQEGESLKATMGDPNASPQQKIEQLNAFIDQKVRDIETKRTEAGFDEGADIGAMSDEELFQ